jgi:16S rRNA (guanine527-N7)-methyltransferase
MARSELSRSELVMSEGLGNNVAESNVSELPESKLAKPEVSGTELAESALPEFLELWQETLHWQPDMRQQAQFQNLYEQILSGNRQFNLTRITEPQEFWEKHLWDSLRGIQSLLTAAHPSPLTVLDIGTGAGFPGLPIAIAQPTWTVTLLDSTRKKISFLNQLRDDLSLENVQTLCDRVEALGQNPRYRATYDLALIRAVSAASVCAEYALPLVKIGGLAILYRGHWQAAETTALEPILEQLGGTLETVETFTTPLTAGERTCLYIRKTAPTPTQFPREIGIPVQKPLGT